MTLSEGERSLSVSLDAFQTSGHPESSACWDLAWDPKKEGLGEGGVVAWQRSTTAKRQSYRPKCRLHPATADVWKHSRSPELSGKTQRSVFLQSNGGTTCGATLGRPSRRGRRRTKQVRSGHLTVQCRGEKPLADMRPVMWRRCVMGSEATTKRRLRRHLDSWERLGSAFCGR